MQALNVVQVLIGILGLSGIGGAVLAFRRFGPEKLDMQMGRTVKQVEIYEKVNNQLDSELMRANERIDRLLKQQDTLQINHDAWRERALKAEGRLDERGEAQ